MSDDRMRELDRTAIVSGAPEDVRHALCYRIGKLNIEVPLAPSLLKKLGTGRYDGQTLWHDDKARVTHPCVKWQTYGVEQFWDVVSEECVWRRSTGITTVGVFSPFSFPTSMSDHAVDALRYAVAATGEKQGDDDEAEG